MMLALSVSFLLLSYMLTWWAGAVGFILANCLNMGLRIMHSLLYIHHYFQSSQWKPLRGLLPSPLLLLALAVSAVVTALSEVQENHVSSFSYYVLSLNIEYYIAVLFYIIFSEYLVQTVAPNLSLFILWFQGVFCCDGGWLPRLVHIGVGAACLLCVFVAVLLTETRLIQFVRTQLLPRYRKKHT